MNLADHEIIQQGLEAKALLEDATFNSVCRSLFDQYHRLIFSTPDSGGRDGVYNQFHALRDVLGELAARQASAIKLMEALGEADPQEGDEVYELADGSYDEE